jgi:hypothetical protein
MTLRPEEPSGPEIVISMPGRQVAERLDLLGMDEAAARAAFDKSISREIAKLADRPPGDDEEEDPLRRELAELPSWLRQEERDALLELDSETWITRTRIAAATAEPKFDGFFVSPEPEDFWWLFYLVTGHAGPDDCVTLLRLILLVFPDEQVTVRLRHRDEGGNGRPTETAPSNALRTMQEFGAKYSPTVVLTEGRTDAEFLREALLILYPYLDDLVRFMDFEVKPEGSASGLVRTVKAFVAARISNRIVAVFDNDSAATDAIRTLPADLPSNVRVLQYPPLELANCYPTYGPPDNDNPERTLSTANVNGLAGSIELYLGQDVLTDADGRLRPVQWKSFLAGVQRYQGEVTCKNDIQRLFRVKVKAARDHGGPLTHQDWTGLQAILQEILHAHRGPLSTRTEKPRLPP